MNINSNKLIMADSKLWLPHSVI